jgi:ribonuclease P/MRP protein subunit RPP40
MIGHCLLKTKKSVDIIYVDFAKAFDSVCHSKLLLKLAGYGITGSALNWISSFLSNRFQCVKVNGTLSDTCNVISGVPQGSILGPSIFLLYINDVADIFSPNVKIKLYTDDLKIYTEIVDINNINLLQQNTDRLVDWSKLWQLPISCTKCSSFSVNSLARNSLLLDFPTPYVIDHVSLPNVSLVKDLGVHIDANLNFHSHINTIVAKTFQRSNLILRCFLCKDPHMLYRVFVAYVLPLLEYCSQIWSPSDITYIKKIESVQRGFTKIQIQIQNNIYNAPCVASESEARMAMTGLRVSVSDVEKIGFELTFKFGDGV